MQQLIDTLTMSSREIAELCEKQHGNVTRDIRVMLIGLYGDEHIAKIVPEQYRNRHSEFVRENADTILNAIVGDDSNWNHQNGRGFSWERDKRGYVVSFSLDKTHTLTLISGYNVKLRKRIIDRWLELEDAARKPPAMPPLPDADMLNALLVMYLQRVLQSGAGLAAMPQLPPSTISADKLAGNVIQHREGERLHGVRRRVLLTPEQWETILDTVERGEETMAQMAREYGISGSTISHRMTMRRQMRLGPTPAQVDAKPAEDGGFSITAAAKSLAVSPKTLFRWLAGHRWIYKRAIGSPWVAYQDKIDSGLLRQRQLTIEHGNGRARLATQVLVTPKGMARLVKDVVVK